MGRPSSCITFPWRVREFITFPKFKLAITIPLIVTTKGESFIYLGELVPIEYLSNTQSRYKVVPILL